MKKFKKSGFLKNKSLDIVSRFFLSSFIIISFFYVAPIIINFTDKNFNNKEFTNNSKSILNDTLNKEKLIEEDTVVESDERDLLYDILEENNSEINLVRYTTSEIDSLFKEVNISLLSILLLDLKRSIKYSIASLTFSLVCFFPLIEIELPLK